MAAMLDLKFAVKQGSDDDLQSNIGLVVFDMFAYG